MPERRNSAATAERPKAPPAPTTKSAARQPRKSKFLEELEDRDGGSTSSRRLGESMQAANTEPSQNSIDSESSSYESAEEYHGVSNQVTTRRTPHTTPRAANRFERPKAAREQGIWRGTPSQATSPKQRIPSPTASDDELSSSSSQISPIPPRTPKDLAGSRNTKPQDRHDRRLRRDLQSTTAKGTSPSRHDNEASQSRSMRTSSILRNPVRQTSRNADYGNSYCCSSWSGCSSISCGSFCRCANWTGWLWMRRYSAYPVALVVGLTMVGLSLTGPVLDVWFCEVGEVKLGGIGYCDG